MLDDDDIVLGTFDRYVLCAPHETPWSARTWGLERVPAREQLPALWSALRECDDATLFVLWRRLLGIHASYPPDRFTMERDLAWHVRPPASVCVWRRLANRGLSVDELPLRETPQPTQRTVEDHWIAVEVVDEAGAPLAGAQLQLVSAGGDVTPLSTDRDGKARADRIQAGRVELSLPQLDLSMWSVDGQEPEPMSADQRFRWHTVVQGECLSKIAHRYGVKSYKLLWDHPKNADLRQKRKSPHVLLPGDLVAVPAVRQGSVTRPTDSTVRVVVKNGATLEVRVRLQSLGRKGLEGLSYKLSFEHRGRTVERPGASPTSADGTLREQVPVGVAELIVRFDRPKLVLQLHPGQLDPALDERTGAPIPSGVAARLRALGYGSAAEPQVLAAFQRHALDREAPSGALDEDTCRKLIELYGV